MKTNLDKIFKTDHELESEGIWFEIEKDVAFRIKRFGGVNKNDVAKKLADYQKPYSRQIQMGTMDQGILEEMQLKVFIETSVVDWKGITVEEKEIPFTRESCLELLKALPDLTDTLVAYSSDSSNYREQLGNY